MKTKPHNRKLFIAGVEWTIRFQREPVLVDEKTVYGYTDPDKLIVAVGLKSVVEVQVKRTLIHELLHAIIDTIGIHHNEDEEVCVTSLETGIYSVINDPRNAWLWEFLQG